MNRVLKPGGIVAEWTYADCHVDAAVDAVKRHLNASQPAAATSS